MNTESKNPPIDPAMIEQEVMGIRQQVIIAQSGRLGVGKGGTIECLRETLAETEAWPIEREHFGIFTVTAQKEKDKAIAEIKKLLEKMDIPGEAGEAPDGIERRVLPKVTVPIERRVVPKVIVPFAMDMKQQLMDFLTALETAVPPPHEKAHHSITLRKYGSDETGWIDQLAVNIMLAQSNTGATTQVMFLEAGDLEKPADQLTAEIVAILNPPGAAKCK